jgi:ribosomal protein L37AE/L43A
VRFYDQKLLTRPRDGVVVSWLLEPEDTDVSAVEVEIQRSESPDGPFVVVQTVDPMTVFSFTDKGAPWRPKAWELYYRLVSRSRSTGEEVHVGQSFGFQGQLPLDALEIIRQHDILLRGVNDHGPYNGTPCTVYKRRNFGPRCPSCVDSVTNRVTISGCRSCSGTGFAGGGYYAPVDTFIAIQPAPRVVQVTQLMKSEDADTSAYMTNYPVMYPGDLIVEPSDKHWRVTAVDVTERRRTLVKQQLRLRQLDTNDIEYETLRHSSYRS